MKRNLLLVFAAAALAGGCSPDGGFFPGMMSHNEGAIDYRVASMSAVDGCKFVSLGTCDSKPYAALDETPALKSYSRMRLPEELQRAEDNRDAAEGTVRMARQDEAVEKRVVDDQTGKVETLRKEVENLSGERKKWEKKLADLQDSKNEEFKNLVETDRARMSGEASAKVDALAGQLQRRTADLQAEQTLLENRKLRHATFKENVAKAESELQTAQNIYNTQRKAYQEAIQKGEAVGEQVETIRVTLKQAYMRGFSEPGPVGEVAVLMTVKESRSGLGQQEPRAGRVVFYSEGVRKDSFMNFRDQPVYGPIRYGGDDLQIRVSIIELDESDNAVAGSILKTLATVGSVAYPPSSPVLATLDQIGASLLTLNGPDLEWDYLMRLSARPPRQAAAPGNTYDAWIRDGYYILMRSDCTDDIGRRSRIDQDLWNRLYLDPQTGVIYEQLYGTDGNPKTFTQYTGHSYIVFALQSGLDSSQLDLAQQATELETVVSAFGGGTDLLGPASEALARSLADSIEKVKQIKQQRKSIPIKRDGK